MRIESLPFAIAVLLAVSVAGVLGKPTLEGLKGTYDAQVQEIQERYRAERKGLLEEYGQSLERTIKALKEEGDPERVLLAMEEKRRFEEARTVPKPCAKRPPKDAAAFGGHHYKVIGNHRGSWTAPNAKCQELGGHLVTFESREEYDFVRKMPAGYPCWIGCRYDRDASKWVWVTGTSIAARNGAGGAACPWDRFAGVNPSYEGCMLIRSGRIEFRGNTGIRKGWSWKEINRFICEWEE